MNKDQVPKLILTVCISIKLILMLKEECCQGTQKLQQLLQSDHLTEMLVFDGSSYPNVYLGRVVGASSRTQRR